tara:strand:- start:702 stop:1073 length:372 start_codon:yes stop_codon:yes gene_type:complete
MADYLSSVAVRYPRTLYYGTIAQDLFFRPGDVPPVLDSQFNNPTGGRYKTKKCLKIPDDEGRPGQLPVLAYALAKKFGNVVGISKNRAGSFYFHKVIDPDRLYSADNPKATGLHLACTFWRIY